MSIQVTNILGNSPATILVALLVDQLGICTRVADQGDWPAFLEHMPDKPDECLCVYDTMGIKDGRMMNTMETVMHHGIEILLRSRDYTAPYTKARSISGDLSVLTPQNFSLLGSVYRVYNVTETTAPTHLGEEAGTIRRYYVSVNMLFAVRKVS